MQLSMRSSRLARPSSSMSRPVVPRMIMVRAGVHPTQKDVEKLNGLVKEAIKEAEDTCNGGDAPHCAAAWDNVEELSAAAAHKKVAFQEDKVASDPLEQFCDDNPDADECRVYDD